MLIRNILTLRHQNLGYRRLAQLGWLIPILLVSSCASWLPDAHKIDIQQGKAIKRESLVKIRPGMTMSAIISILGTPTLQDSFHTQRWDYVYNSVPGEGESQASRLTLFFDNGILTRVDDSAYREVP